MTDDKYGGVRLPERLYDFDGGAGMLSLKIWLHQYARRAAVYHVNKVKRIGPPVCAINSRRQT